MRDNSVFILWCQTEIANLAKISYTQMSCPSYQKPYFTQESLTFCPCLTLFIERANCLTNVLSFAGDQVSTSHRMHQGRKHVPSQRSTEARPSTSGSWWVFLTCEKICFVALLQYSSPLQQVFCTQRHSVLYFEMSLMRRSHADLCFKENGLDHEVVWQSPFYDQFSL